MIATSRYLIRCLQMDLAQAPMVLKFVHGVLLFLIFAPLWAYLRLRTAAFGYVNMHVESESGLQFECQLPDMIQTYVYLFGVWEPDCTALVRRRLKPGDTFVDVGANVGYFTLLAGQVVGANGKVIAIEASPAIFDRLQENVVSNQLSSNIHLVRTAVMEVSGSVDMYRGPAHNMGLTSTRAHRGMRFEQSVPAAPLDHILSDADWRRARLIKIDVEGGEDAVLAGMARCIDRLGSDAEILVELSPTWWEDSSKTPQDVLRPFLDAGFNVYEIPNNYWPWRYLWPRSVARPRRVRADLGKRVKRLDIVLSRIDAPVL